MTPPLVSMPSDSGVTSRSRTSLTSPLRTPAWMAAPMATTSSGFTPLWGSLPVIALHQVGNRRHAGGSPDQDHVLDLVLGEPGVLDRLFERRAAALEQIGRHLLELGPGEREVEVQRAVAGRGDEGEVDLRLLDCRQLDLGLLGRLLEALDGHVVLGEVDAVVVLEVGDQPVDDTLVPVVATEAGVAMGGLDLEDALADLEDRDVERAPTEVEYQDRLVGASLSSP